MATPQSPSSTDSPPSGAKAEWEALFGSGAASEVPTTFEEPPPAPLPEVTGAVKPLPVPEEAAAPDTPKAFSGGAQAEWDELFGSGTPSSTPIPETTPQKQAGVSAAKKKVIVPAYIRKHLDTTESGEPMLYITQAPNQGLGINVARHKLTIKQNLLKEEKERWKKSGREWGDLPEEIKTDIEKTVSNKADRLLNSWIDEQRGTTTLWVKGDPNYEKDELIKKAENSLAYRAWAPFEALLFPQTTEVITKTDVGKTFQQLNDFEGAMGWLAYLGRFAPSTLIYTAVAGGGWGTPEHLRELKAGKDALTYTVDLGDWMTDRLESMGIVDSDTSGNWWVNAVAGGLITGPIILAEPDIATAAGGIIGLAAGGPVGAAGGFLASKGAKGAKALLPAMKLNKVIRQATKGKEELLAAVKTAEELGVDPTRILVQEAHKVINSSQKTTMGRVLKETVATRLATDPIKAQLAEDVILKMDAMQDARKAAPDTIGALEDLGDLSKLEGDDLVKLENLMKGNEESVLEYYQAKVLANKMVADELAVNERFARGLSQFKPKTPDGPAFKANVKGLKEDYNALEAVEKALLKSGADKKLLRKRADLLTSIQKRHKTWGKMNTETALNIASKRAQAARKAAKESLQQYDAVDKAIKGGAQAPDLAKALNEIRKAYKANKKTLKKAVAHRDAKILYETTLAALDDIIDSTQALKKNLGVKAKVYSIPELQESLSALHGTTKIDEVVDAFDTAFGKGVFTELVSKSGSAMLRSGVLEKASVEVTSEILDELKSAIPTLLAAGVRKQKSDLGIELAEQAIRTSDFMTNITNVAEGAGLMRWMGRASEFAKGVANPARKLYGSTAEAVVKAGRAMGSFSNRAHSEIGEVFITKIVRDDKFQASLKNIKDSFRAEAEGFLSDAKSRGGGEIFPKDSLPREHVAELLRILTKGKDTTLGENVKLLQDFLKSPNEKVFITLAETAMKKSNLRKLMYTTEAVKTATGDTMSNLGKSSWWDTSLSWWKRNLAKKAPDETLEAFVRSFVGQTQDATTAKKAVDAAVEKLKGLLKKGEDETMLWSQAEIASKVRKTLYSKGATLSADSPRTLASRAAILSAASSQEKALFDVLRRVGGVSDEVVEDLASMMSGRRGDIKNFREVFDTFERYGLSTSRDAWKTVRDNVDAALKVYKVDGRNVLVPTAMIKSLDGSLRKLTNELSQYNPDGDQALNMIGNSLAGFFRLWRTSIVTGLLFPNPTHFVNIFFGNLSQMWGEISFKTATTISAQTLKDFVPFFGKKLDDALVESQVKYGKNGALASTFNAILNPQVGAFFNRTLAKDSDKILGVGAKYVKTWGELREIALREGVLSTFIGTDLKKALGKQMMRRMEGKSGKAWDTFLGEPYKQFAEAVEQRQRVALFMDLVVKKGMPPGDAAKKVNQALYDWDAPMSHIETAYLNNIFLFWRFWKQSLTQASRHLTDPLRKPPETVTDLIKYSMFQKSPVSRGVAQAKLVGAIPELSFDKMTHDMEKRIEDGTATDRDRYMYLLSMQYPSWKKGGNKVFLANYPIDSQLSDQYLKVHGREVSHEAVTMPGLTTLDTYGMLLGLLGGLSAAAVTGKRALSGDEDVTKMEAVKAALRTIVEPAQELASPPVEALLDELVMDPLMGNTFNYQNARTRLKPSEKALLNLMNAGGFITKGDYVSRKVGGKKPDPEGLERLNTTVLNLYRLTPFFGTQLSRTFDPMLEAHERGEYAAGLTHVLRQLSGIAKTYKHSPERELASTLYEIRREGRKEKDDQKYEPVED